jgi:predicted glycosyltransferase
VVVVPFSEGREDEQSTRARRLERLGVLRVLEAGELDGASLLAAARQALRDQPAKLDLDLDGRAGTARLLAALAEESGEPQRVATVGAARAVAAPDPAGGT